MKFFSPKGWVIALAAIGFAFSAQPANAAYQTQSFTLDQSNTLTDGVNYGTVTVESYDGVGAPGGGLLAGQIRLTFDVTTAPYPGLGNNFGIDKAAFNFQNLTITASDIDTVPTGWDFDIAPPSSNVSDFGHFEIFSSGQGNDRRDPVVILISNQGLNALVQNVVGASEDGFFFVAHVAGFNEINGQTSHFIGNNGGGGGNVVPAPPAVLLLASAVPVLAFRRLIRRKRAA